MSDSGHSIYSKRLLSIKRHCPECHEILHPTGWLKGDDTAGEVFWGVEYECKKEREIFVIWDIERKDLIASIAHANHKKK